MSTTSSWAAPIIVIGTVIVWTLFRLHRLEHQHKRLRKDHDDLREHVLTLSQSLNERCDILSKQIHEMK